MQRVCHACRSAAQSQRRVVIPILWSVKQLKASPGNTASLAGSSGGKITSAILQRERTRLALRQISATVTVTGRSNITPFMSHPGHQRYRGGRLHGDLGKLHDGR